MSVVERMRAAVKAAVGAYQGQISQESLTMLRGISGTGLPAVRGARDVLEAYSTMPWLRAVAHRIASGVAATPWKLYVARKPGKPATQAAWLQRAPLEVRQAAIRRKQAESELEEISEHPLLTLLTDANAYHTGVAVRKVTQVHLDLLGEAFWVKERGGLRQPIAVWPLPPHWVMATPTPIKRSYRVAYSGWQAEIPDSEVLWFCDLDPVNPYGRGSGTALALGDELDTDEAAAKYTKQFFLNSARPDFLIYPKAGALTDANVRRLEEDWNARNQGFWKALKAHFLTREVGVHEFSAQGDLRAMQMTELRKYERDCIIQVFGVSPEMLGIVAGADRAHAEAAEYQFAKYALVPRLEFLRATFQERLVPEYDERLVLDYESPVGQDRDYFLKCASVAPWSRNVDEWRELQDLPELEDDEGKVFMVPIGVTPMQSLLPTDSPLIPANGGELGMPAAMGVREDAEDAIVLKEAGDLEGSKQIEKQMADDLSDLPAVSRVAARLEPALRRRFLAAVAAARDKIDLEALTDALRAGHATEAEVAAKLDALAGSLGGMVVELKAGFLAGAKIGYENLASAGVAVNFDLVNQYAVTWARTQGSGRVTVITEETREAIRDLIGRSFTEGWDARKTARQLVTLEGFGLNRPQMQASLRFREALEEDGVAEALVDRRVARYNQALLRQRGRLVARNEMLTASNTGQDALWQEAKKQGAISEDTTRRVWILTMDDRLCELCFPAKTPILTLHGWKPISKVQVGEYVLTHQDRFQRVTKRMSRHHDGSMVHIVIGGRDRLRVTATANHPFLTQRGWIRADELTTEDDLRVIATHCLRCHLLLAAGPNQRPKLCRTCRPAVANTARWKSPEQHERLRKQNVLRWARPGEREKAGQRLLVNNPARLPDIRAKIAKSTRERFALTGSQSSGAVARQKLSEANRRRVNAGTHPFCAANRDKYIRHPMTVEALENVRRGVQGYWRALTPEERLRKHARMMAGNSRSARGSRPELELARWLDTQGIAHIRQWPFSYLDGSRIRHGFADFYIPAAKLVIECDGWWHMNDSNQQRRDALRDTALVAQALTVLRVPSRDIERKLENVGSKIRAHCCTTWIRPKKIIHKQVRHQPVYNLEVAEDHTYIAGGFVVHNCEPMEDAEATLSGPFISPKTKQEHMRPPLHIQCRCSVGLRFVQRETVTQLLQRGFRETAEAVLKAVREPRTETVEKDVKRDASGLVTGMIERRTTKQE